MNNSASLRLGFLGGGNMAESILRGVIACEVLPAGDVYVTDISEERRGYLASNTEARVVATNAELVEGSDVIVLAVKPQGLQGVLEEIKPIGRRDQLFLSICAGKHTDGIEEGLCTSQNPEPRVVRVMPNLPARIGLGMAGICGGAHTSEKDLDFPRAVFEAVGEVVVVSESLMDAVTAISGSGPAYVFYAMEAMMEAAKSMGFADDQAKVMVRQTFLGSVQLACQSADSPAELRRQVTSKGGTTAAGVAVLEENKVRDHFIECVRAAARRAKELSGD